MQMPSARAITRPKIITSASALLVLLSTANLPALGAPSPSEKAATPVFRPQGWPATKNPGCVIGQIIVVPGPKMDSDAMKEVLDEVQGKIVRTIKMGTEEFDVIAVDKSRFPDTYNKLRKDKRFQCVSLNTECTHLQFPSSGNPDDPDLSQQAQLVVQNVLNSYAIAAGKPGEGGDGVTIAVIDTGVQGTQSDMGGRVLTGVNLVSGGPGNIDVETNGLGHGTFCATEMASETNNGLFGASTIYKSKIYPVTIFAPNSGSTTTADIIAGVKAVSDTNIRIISLSVNGSVPNTLNANHAYMLAARYFFFHNNGLIFNSAGNTHVRDDSLRTAYNTVSAAVDSNLNPAFFTTYGNAISFSGLGIGVASSRPDGFPFFEGSNQFGPYQGTSFSSPQNAAIAALMEGLNPSLSNLQVLNLMVLGSVRFNQSSGLGLGIPQANVCASLALNPPNFIPNFFIHAPSFRY